MCTPANVVRLDERVRIRGRKKRVAELSSGTSPDLHQADGPAWAAANTLKAILIHVQPQAELSETSNAAMQQDSPPAATSAEGLPDAATSEPHPGKPLNTMVRKGSGEKGADQGPGARVLPDTSWEVSC